MEILVFGGTRFFGVHLVHALLDKGHHVTVATRGLTPDNFGDAVKRIAVDRSKKESVQAALGGRAFDVVCDNIAYCSNDVRYALDAVKCNKYILTSTGSVYSDRLGANMLESGFDPFHTPLEWCDHTAYTYDKIKQQAECAAFQAYGQLAPVAVRLPFVIGADDYTKRLYFYVEHVVKQMPMQVDNLDSGLGFIKSTEAGQFLAYVAEQPFTGTINAASEGTISLRQIITYVQKKTGKQAILTDEGEAGSYNGTPDFSLNTQLAQSIGFKFSSLDAWIYPLLDEFILQAQQ